MKVIILNNLELNLKLELQRWMRFTLETRTFWAGTMYVEVCWGLWQIFMPVMACSWGTCRWVKRERDGFSFYDQEWYSFAFSLSLRLSLRLSSCSVILSVPLDWNSSRARTVFFFFFGSQVPSFIQNWQIMCTQLVCGNWVLIYLDKGVRPDPSPFLVACYVQDASQSSVLFYKITRLLCGS